MKRNIPTADPALCAAFNGILKDYGESRSGSTSVELYYDKYKGKRQWIICGEWRDKGGIKEGWAKIETPLSTYGLRKLKEWLGWYR